LAAGLAASRSWTTSSVRLRAGGAVALKDPFGAPWRFVSQGVSRDQGVNYIATGVALEAWRGAWRLGIVSTEGRQYFDGAQRPTFEPSVEPGIRSTPRLDLYIALAEVRGETTDVRVSFHPFVALIWVGWVLLGLGGFAAAAGGRPGAAAPTRSVPAG
jgi:cytochrome c biogenesis factor